MYLLHPLYHCPSAAVNKVPLSQGDFRAAFAHVLWIGGATDSGKASVARALAEKHGLQAYHYDLYERVELPGHWTRTDPVHYPHMHASGVRDRDWMWVDTTPQDLVERWFRTTTGRFLLTLEDLLVLPSGPPIVAEGYGFSPELVLPVLSSVRQAVWWSRTRSSSGPPMSAGARTRPLATRAILRGARNNHMARDLLLVEHTRRRAEELGLTVVEIDGTQPLDKIISMVEAHFEPFLSRAYA